MNKYKMFIVISLTILSSLLFTSNVKAEERIYNVDLDGNAFNVLNEVYSSSFIDNYIDELVSEWESEYKSDYPYYVISVLRNFNEYDLSIILYPRSSIPARAVDNSVYFPYGCYSGGKCYSALFRNFKDGVLVDKIGHVTYDTLFYHYYVDGNQSNIVYLYYFSAYYDSNFNMPFGLEDTYIIRTDEEILFTLNNPTDIIPTYKNLIVEKKDLDYVEVNLNDYPYVALSLKDYSKKEEFTSIFYVQGQFCLTPVYNFGQTEKKDIIAGSQNQRCSLAYDTFSPVRTYILKSDLENNAIYYLKAYDTSIENKVKIDTSVFNIHYITEDDKDNPILNINGRDYAPKSYDDLSDTATKSEDENFGSGGVCMVGDLNCTRQYTSFSWSDIFDGPLDFLKGIWDSIVAVFEVIIYFISILPSPLQSFLYFSFMLAVVLGLIKIIL